ncbi:LOW QUALITY PROTEIN: WAT1-related protein At1g44800-like [Salvia splendens]|uniref:LOW QUALITY PROTEIN: WAT1-related protein At1g44800-like n=1 Tax=Salvia splendens TaxID=180675 RepID=UPI001C26E3B2|nr:LOW QUALITY PROTEIN: WAT1-related protein At1g44800-like [Salvia splendens]
MGCESLNKMKPYLAMITLQFGYAGMHIILLLSFKRGFSHWVFVVYRHAVATIFFSPFAYFFERKTRPNMTKSIFFKIMLLGFLEPVLDQNLYGVGIQYTSATFAAATVNILPAVTFIMAVLFRMEKVNLKKVHSVAKVIGTAVTVGGAMVMTLYKGPTVNILFLSHGGSHHEATSSSADEHWVSGTIMLLASIVGWAAFFILQNNTLKEYPAELSLTALICLMGTVEGGIVAAIMERGPSAWAIGFDSRLLAATYSGLICSGIAYYLQSVVNKARGPVFVTSFSPLSMIITAILGAIILSDQLHVGMVIGAVIIVSGLYCVVWGKAKEDSPLIGKSQELPIVGDMIPSDNGSTKTTQKINSLA